jgi:hypothetical protein
VNAASPLFSGEKNLHQAFKVMAFSRTPMWLAAMFIAVPAISLYTNIFIFAFAYMVLLLHFGLSELMKVKGIRTLFYTATVVGTVWSATTFRKLGIPAIIDYSWQWSGLSQDTKTLLVVFLFLSVALIVGFYTKYRNVT